MLFKISKFFLHAAVFAVIIVTISTLFPFIVGKYTWFRAMVDLALISFLAGLIFDRDGKHYLSRLKQFFRSPVVITVTAFTLFFVLACFFGVRPSFSFWSNFERGEGGIQILNLYAFFILLITLFKEDKDWRKMFWLSMIAATLMILYGVVAGLQLFILTPSPASPHAGQGGAIMGWSVIGPAFNSPGFRFQGSLGNSEYVPGYLVFMIFFASYLLFGGSKKISLKSWESLGLIGLIVLFLSFCIMSGTRGAFLGLIAGFIVSILYIGFYRKEWRKWLMIGACLAIASLILLVQFRHVPAIQKIPGASSLLRLKFDSSDLADLHTRFVMWDTAVQGWKERPLFGWGPENFLPLFDKHYEIRYYNPENGFGAWFDRAHSTLFDYLAQIGILGLLSYLGIFICLGLLLFKKKWHEAAKADPKRMMVQGLFLGILVTYLVQGTVLFDVFALYLPLFTLFAFAVYYFHPLEVISREKEVGQVALTLSAIGIILAILGLYLGSLLPLLKAQSFIDASRNMTNVRSVDEFKANFDQSFNLYSPVGTEEVSKFLGSNIMSILNQGQSEPVSRQLVEYIEGHLFKDEVRHLLLLAQMYQTLWQEYGNELDYQKAIGYLEKAHEIGPNLPPPLYKLFNLYNSHGDKDNSQRIGRLILANWPQDKETSSALNK